MNAEYKNLITFVWVKDWDRAVTFYTDVMGCGVGYQSEGWAELSVPGLKGGFLALNLWKAPGDPPTNSFITLGVDDAAEARTRLTSLGVRMHGDMMEFLDEDQGLRMFKFYDPDSNILTIASTVG